MGSTHPSTQLNQLTANFFSAVETRRSTNAVGPTSPISDAAIIHIIQQAVKHGPSPFDIQSCRTIILFGDNHRKLWDMAWEDLTGRLPESALGIFKEKVEGYRAGYGTVLFFDDRDAVKLLPESWQKIVAQYPECKLYPNLLKLSNSASVDRRFPHKQNTSQTYYICTILFSSTNHKPLLTANLSGAEQSIGMVQYIAWTALCSSGLGVSLQHYNPGLDPYVAKTWPHPESWVLKAQMVFGVPTGPPRGGMPKPFTPVEPRVIVEGHGDGREIPAIAGLGRGGAAADVKQAIKAQDIQGLVKKTTEGLKAKLGISKTHTHGAQEKDATAAAAGTDGCTECKCHGKATATEVHPTDAEEYAAAVGAIKGAVGDGDQDVNVCPH
jgi:predicted oxidoreductase (fatty acid repression mutant protein)